MTAGTYSRATWTGLGLIAACVIVTLLFSSQIRSRAEQVADALAQAPLVTVADFPAEGTARVEGRVQLVEPSLIAPLSGQRCAFYELEVEGLGGLDGGVRQRRKTQGRDFLLADASGMALVRLESAMIAPGSGMIGALVAIDEAHCRQGTLAEIAAEKRDAALRLLGERAPDAELGEIRYRECVLAPDASVAVAGAGLKGRAPGRGAAPGRAGRVTLAATPRQPLYIAVAGRQ
jgi:hypothetical protein